MADHHSPYDPDPRQGNQGGNTRTQALQATLYRRSDPSEPVPDYDLAVCDRTADMAASQPPTIRNPEPHDAALAQTRIYEIDSTVGVMQKNIDLVVNRGQRLDNLQDKTDNLAQSAQGFRRGANRVRKQMWWKDMKMRMCLIVGVIILILIIVIPIVVTKGK
ncbi:hypothetical protein VP1G_03408 [Cytospora mali]|uniref:V-SNARE coiled-coil homology domain-containing protein n=1 Tax=Cytospora mali TaxID=578113 RepID=A0A194UWP4_CYTMA|nr:hypothetical protein VP1G_03408 [Valsa mali var. pyri (nom. inval.)]